MRNDEFECLTGFDDDGTVGIECGRFVAGSWESLIQIEARSLPELMQTFESATTEAERTIRDMLLHWDD